MRKRIVKKILSVMLVLCLVVVQPSTVKAAEGEQLSMEQLNNILDGVNSIVWQLEEIGLNDREIYELFQLNPRENEFYVTTQTESIPFNGSFIMESSYDGSESEIITYADYNGNPPPTDDIQKQRIQNIYSVALQHYHSDFYQGPSRNGEDFGKYLTYLYISHYIDGPGRVPTASDLPYIISTDDISAYEFFLKNARLSNWATAMAGFGAVTYSNIDYFQGITAINTVDQLLSKGIDDAAMAGVNGYNTADALVTIVPLIKSAFIEKYYTASSDEELTEDTLLYVTNQLEPLGFYENYDRNITNTIINIIATTFISALCNSVSLIGLGVSVVPLYVYEATGLIEKAALVNLQYSFSGRYAVRTGIYIGF